MLSRRPHIDPGRAPQIIEAIESPHHDQGTKTGDALRVEIVTPAGRGSMVGEVSERTDLGPVEKVLDEVVDARDLLNGSDLPPASLTRRPRY
jgi:hypothetical protein